MALPKSVPGFPTQIPKLADFSPRHGVSLRKLTARDLSAYQAHLLRLTPSDRCNRFMGAVSDDRVRTHCDSLAKGGTIVLGAFVDGVLRGAGEFAMVSAFPRPVAEIALSVEDPWQDQGIGTQLLRHVLTLARNRCVSRVYLLCLLDNLKMQKIARKFEANLIFEEGGVEGSVWPYWPNYKSLLEEAVTDGQAFFNTIVGPQKPTSH